MSILGIDISTQKIGIAIIDKSSSLIHKDVIKLPSCSLEERGIIFRDYLREIKERYIIEKIFIEEPLKSGGPNANTVAILNYFNGMCSYIAYDVFNKFPVKLNPCSARAKLGIKIPRTKKQIEKKKPIIEYIQKRYQDSPTPFEYAMTPKGNPKPGTDDIADAIVLCLAGADLI